MTNSGTGQERLAWPRSELGSGSGYCRYTTARLF